MSACERWEESISCYLDGELTKEEEQALLAHAADCPSCAATLQLYTRLFGPGEIVPVPKGFTRSVMGATSLLKAPARAKKRPAVIRFLALAAACLLVVVVAIPLLQSRLGRKDAAQNVPAAGGMMLKSTITAGAAVEGSAEDRVEEESVEIQADSIDLGESKVAMRSVFLGGGNSGGASDATASGAENAMPEEAEAPMMAMSANDAESNILPFPAVYVYGELPECCDEAELDFEDLGEGMVLAAPIDAELAKQLIALGYEYDADGTPCWLVWYPAG